jgi:hypothetical protein
MEALEAMMNKKNINIDSSSSSSSCGCALFSFGFSFNATSTSFTNEWVIYYGSSYHMAMDKTFL